MVHDDLKTIGVRNLKWPVAIRHQAITWANFDPELYHHMESLGHNDLIVKPTPDFVDVLLDDFTSVACMWMAIKA